MSRQDSNILLLMGVYMKEKSNRTIPERRAPQIPYQNTAF